MIQPPTQQELAEIQKELASLDGVKGEPVLRAIVKARTTVRTKAQREAAWEKEEELAERFPHLDFDFRVRVKP